MYYGKKIFRRKKGDGMNINECRAIYREAFGNDGDFEDRIFSECTEHIRTLCVGGKTVSLLFALPCNIHSNGDIIPAYYIFAAATKKEFRGNGYMSRLLGSLETDRLLFLKPASAPLFKFYEKLGFKRFELSANKNSLLFAEPTAAFAKLILTEKPVPTDCTALYKYKADADISGMYFPYLME